MANIMSPALIAFRTSFERSNVASLILLPRLSCLIAARVGADPVGPSARMPLMLESDWTAAAIACWAPVGSLRSTWRTLVVPARPVAKPLQRASRAALPTSWLMHNALVTPAAFMSAPAFSPEIVSSWPTWVRMPSALYESDPEFAEMTGMPAATAFWMLGPRAVASGIDTTSPAGFFATAASMRAAILTMSKVSGALYSTLTPMSLPAWSTPFLKIDQNGSEAWPWVTTSMRIDDRSGPAAPGDAVAAELEQAATMSPTTAKPASIFR